MPVKFEVYRSGQRLREFQPVAAYIVGPESVPITGEVVFRDGLLTAQRADEIPMGVSLLWNAGPAGTCLLETTRLLPRPEPYNLNVELARFRLMKIVQKQEDWNLFDFPKAETYLAKFKEAQDFLAEALGKLGDPPAAAALADEALVRGMQLSEELALFHADLLITRRRSTGGFVKHIFGCRVDTSVQNQKYREMLAGNFDYAVLPTPWKLLQPQEAPSRRRRLTRGPRASPSGGCRSSPGRW